MEELRRVNGNDVLLHRYAGELFERALRGALGNDAKKNAAAAAER